MQIHDGLNMGIYSPFSHPTVSNLPQHSVNVPRNHFLQPTCPLALTPVSKLTTLRLPAPTLVPHLPVFFLKAVRPPPYAY